MNSKHSNFFIVSNKIFDFNLSANTIAVYCCLLMFADREKLSCFPSHRMICEKCNLTKNTVIKCLRKLEEVGLVQIKSRKRWNNSNSSNIYFLCDPSVENWGLRQCFPPCRLLNTNWTSYPWKGIKPHTGEN